MCVSDLWRLRSHEFCECDVADVLAEGFVDVGVDRSNVEARIAGQCIVCGSDGVTGWLEMGSVDPYTDDFRAVVPESIHRPRPVTR